MLKINGTQFMDSIQLPQSETVSGILKPANSFVGKIMQMLGMKKSLSQDNLVSNFKPKTLPDKRSTATSSHSQDLKSFKVPSSALYMNLFLLLRL